MNPSTGQKSASRRSSIGFLEARFSTARRSSERLPTTSALLTTQSEPEINTASYRWLQGIHGDVSALGKDIGFKANPIDLFAGAKLGVQELVGVQHNQFTVTGDILWTPVEVRTSNSLLNPAPDGAITMVVRCSAPHAKGKGLFEFQNSPLARQVMP